ncbi:MAG: aminoglycoside adenylyltransferase domain-containing protein [Mycobacteriales bacterium]
MSPLASGYADVDDLLTMLRVGVETELGDALRGLYVTGSLSYGDFDHGSSDIDFLAVTGRRFDGADRAALAAMHAGIAERYPVWAERIEGSYVLVDLLAHDAPPAEPRPYVNQGRLWDPDPGYGQEWLLNRYVLHHRAIPLIGPPAAEMFPEVPEAAMRAASVSSLHEEWEPLLQEPTILDDPHHAAYITLTLCRILHTAHVGGVASKRVAARWVIEQYGDRWAGLVTAALAWRHGEALDRREEILELIRFAATDLA